MKRLVKRLARALPLGVRLPLASALSRAAPLPRQRRRRWAAELVRDLADRDVNAYHGFLWRHHLDYAAPYEAELRFGEENMRGSRWVFFDDLRRRLGGAAVGSVLEVGCSCGYQLRHLETSLAPAPGELVGVDVDADAVAAGRAWLARAGSRVRLLRGDLEGLPAALGDRAFDVVLCTGVLMYLDEARAARAVAALLARTRRLLALSGPAWPDGDNRDLDASRVRGRDRTLIHNLDRMVARAGGRVVGRRWEGPRRLDGQTLYFVFAAPARVGAAADG